MKEAQSENLITLRKVPDLHTEADGVWAYVGANSVLIEQDDDEEYSAMSDLIVLHVSSAYELRDWLNKVLP